MKFVLEAAKVHFAEANFEKLKVPQRFGPTFFTTTLVSNDCHALGMKIKIKIFISGPFWRHTGEDDS